MTHFAGKQEFTTDELAHVLHSYSPDSSRSTISWKINQLKKAGAIYQIGRGLYTFYYKPEFSTELSLKSKRIYNRIKGVYAEDIVVWDTVQLGKIYGDELTKYWVFVALNRKDLDLVFTEMLSFSKKVFVNPDKETAARYLIAQEEAIILTALASETPFEEFGSYLCMSIEGILVNTLLEYENILKPIGLDIHKLFTQAFSNYNVNKNRLLRYATRRDKKREIIGLLKTIE
ncbi:hypothetical protein SAMN04487996_102359 [Dyadobacter soli]|uniref:Uncharacterized protein n=1 Tax=Dyadobacter soli TaxID=659014 RepID=A0A1G6Y788_9BACT|nr:DUF6577 family protein [Dyadobacter soli]SDD85813.1 hypothetical protein SAMN04487996_102359 [Dyadobacter soli]